MCRPAGGGHWQDLAAALEFLNTTSVEPLELPNTNIAVRIAVLNTILAAALELLNTTSGAPSKLLT